MEKQPTLEEIKDKIRRRLGNDDLLESGQYKEFKREEHLEYSLNTFFEKYCEFAVRYIPYHPKPTGKEEMQDDIDVSGLNVTLQGVGASAILTVLISIFAMLPFWIVGLKNFGFFLIVVGMFFAYVLYTYPKYSAEIIRIRAQQESLLAVLYMTIYMRVNPVLEKAIFFATEHLEGPLSKDLKQILWMLDMEKISNIEEGVNFFASLWMKRNRDFVKAFLTLHSVLDQQSQQGQERVLDKALGTILNDTYEKMKHYSHDLRTPVMVLHTFGMMLPLIGLIAFPMINAFMAENVKISYLFFGYIVVLPALIFFLSQRILSKRPGAFSFPDMSHVPGIPPKGFFEYSLLGKKHLMRAMPIALLVGFIIMIPGIMHLVIITGPAFAKSQSEGIIPKGEYELSSMLYTITVPIGFAAFFILLFYLRSYQRVKVRNNIIEIEEDLSASLFQLANQFTENIPVEVAIDKFLQNYNLLNLKKRVIYDFFYTIMNKMRNLGYNFRQAIFNRNDGIINYYPSALLKEIMWIITEGSQKGAKTLYTIMNKISIYLENVRKVRELIYDLLNETVGSIKMQAEYLSPFIAALVGSLTFIIIKSLYEMLQQLEKIMGMLTVVGAESTGGDNFFSSFINFTKMTPPTIFQVLVGIYLVENIILLSNLANGVENGFDETSRDMLASRSLITGMLIYVVITAIGVYVLNNFISPSIIAG